MKKNGYPYKQEIPRRVRLVAPTDLNGGYEFPVRLENRATFKVSVPPQGVRQGENFIAPVIQDGNCEEYTNEDFHFVTEEMAIAADPQHVPYGRFRDGLCACGKYGIFHPHCFLGCCCPVSVLGQVLTRLKLNHWGNPLPPNNNSQWTTFQVLTVTALYFTITSMFLQTLGNNYGVENDEEDLDSNLNRRNGWIVVINALSTLVSLLYTAYVIVLVYKARRKTRRIYNIPSGCGACSDCCCACCCSCCTICLLARHTADYSAYDARYCTDTGLGRGAPEIL